ncbi:CAP domain-containing protein [Clostridium hydrogenum]|uniref:CAP domain-containing protein n=1 Tax=Clostridium hydrogenum TaxID=2855764 RepID=UPI001F221BB9|nr:CAP domain-containing protein [Clostridium hydrogenum]
MKKSLKVIFITAFILSMFFSNKVYSKMQQQTYNYTIKTGDTLWKIAVANQSGVAEIVALNPSIANPNMIIAGQVIKIPDISQIKVQENEVARLVNIERSKVGLPALKYNWELSRVARAKSQDMADKNYFSHQSPTFGSTFSLITKYGIVYSAAGENIAYGYINPSTVMNGWMNSPGHKANILGKQYNEIGVGLTKNSKGQIYWTQIFIKK